MGNQCCQEQEGRVGQSKFTKFDHYYFQEDSQQMYNPIFKNSNAVNSTPINEYNQRQPCSKPLINTKIQKTLQNQKLSKIYQSNTIKGTFDNQYYIFKRSGNIYYGQWQNNLPHGSGTMYYQKGNVYQGIFIEAVPFQYGQLIMTSGAYYDGQIKYGKANGQGIYCDGEYTYKGFFKNDLKHGAGEQQQQGSYYFIGQYENGEKTKGKYRYSNNIYQGSFQNDQFHGKGQLQNQDGSCYKGHFKAGKFNGYGDFKWKDESLYRGNYAQGLRDGDGQYFNSKDFSISRGIWKRGILNGQGQYTDYRGNVTKCIWNEGKMIGIKTV